MVLYTLLSYEEIFPNEQTSYKLISYHNRNCYVLENEAGDLQIAQLLSTNPYDFLQQKYNPGQVINREEIEFISNKL